MIISEKIEDEKAFFANFATLSPILSFFLTSCG